MKDIEKAELDARSSKKVSKMKKAAALVSEEDY